MFYVYSGSIILCSYLAGSVPFGLITARLAGNIDIRDKGSGNIGATNVGRILGKKWGTAVFILDFFKGWTPVYFGIKLIRILVPDLYMSSLTVHLIMVCAGLAAISGHIFPVYLRFRGGKGVATSAGVFFALSWQVAAAACGVWIILALATRYISVASISAALLTPVLYVIIEYEKAFSGRLPVFVFTCLTALLVVLRHQSNIRRLIKGTEAKVLQQRRSL